MGNLRTRPRISRLPNGACTPSPARGPCADKLIPARRTVRRRYRHGPPHSRVPAPLPARRQSQPRLQARPDISREVPFRALKTLPHSRLMLPSRGGPGIFPSCTWDTTILRSRSSRSLRDRRYPRFSGWPPSPVCRWFPTFPLQYAGLPTQVLQTVRCSRLAGISRCSPCFPGYDPLAPC